MATKLSSAAAPCGVMIIVLALLLTLHPSPSCAQQTVSDASDPEISQAEQHFRLGVTLYKDGNFREALDEFNRALALDPDLEDATRYRENTQEQLNVSATGEDPTAQPTFESFDPESIGPLEESPQLSPEEHKIQKVRELVELAEQYLEFQFYDQAVEYFEQVLLIAPDNERARKGLHEATLGAYRQEIKESQGSIREQTQRMRTDIEKMKLLPEGADSFGIRNPRINVPRIEERVQEVEERSYIEEILENPVGVVFEDIHLQDILDFITDTYEVNIIVDNRVVQPPRPPQVQQGPGQGAPPGQRPGQRRGGAAQRRGGGGGGVSTTVPTFGAVAGAQRGRGRGRGRGQAQNEIVTDGMISYINLKNVTLGEALKALLRPLNLDYSVQRSFIWISTAEKIRVESFEELETKFYELQNAGAETLFKIVLTNPGGFGTTVTNAPGGGGGGGIGGGGGGIGGGGGGIGGGGGGIGGGGGGIGGGGGGGFGGGGGGIGGGGGGIGGGGGGIGGGGGGIGGGGGGIGGGGGGGGGGNSFSNISDLFGTIDDTQVGEFPNPFGAGAGGGGGAFGGGGGGIGGGGGGFGGGGGGFGGAGAGAFGGGGGGGDQFVGGPGPGLGAAAGFVGEPTAIQIIRSLIPPVIEPVSLRLLSFMRYNILTNALVVHTTPTNHARLEELLKDLDAQPKQVSIEAKFLTISVTDVDKSGFKWDFMVSDLNNRRRDVPGVTDNIFNFDIDGDGDLDAIPGNFNPDGSNVINNTVSMIDLVTGLASPSTSLADTFSLTAGIISNADGDMLSVTYDFLDSLGESELLSSPRITTMNQKPAVIADIETEFFLTNVTNSTVVIATGGIGGFSDTPISEFQTQTFSSFIFGITLSVTPQISGNQVRLWLNPQVTRIKERKTFEVRSSVLGSDTSTFITLPTVVTEAVWTNVIVGDGDTLVLGGTVRDSTLKQEDRFPWLADLPVLGFFFRGKTREVQQASLLIFVTPTIIDSSGARYFESDL